MEEKHREVLFRNRAKLIKRLEVKQLLQHLLKEKVLNNEDVEAIRAEDSRTGAAKLLDILPTRGPRAFGSFCDALEQSEDLRHLVILLKENVFDIADVPRFHYSEPMVPPPALRGHSAPPPALRRSLSLSSALCSRTRASESEIPLEPRYNMEQRESDLTIAELRSRLGQYDEDIELHEQELTIAKQNEDKAREGRAYGNLGMCYLSLGQYSKAIEQHEEELCIAKQIRDKAGKERAYGNLGMCYCFLGQYDEAIEHHKRELYIAIQIRDKAGEERAYGNLGMCYRSLGQYNKAIEHHKRELNIAKQIGDKANEIRAYGNLGLCYHYLGLYHKAITHYEREMIIAIQIGVKAGKTRAYENLDLCYRSRGQHDGAIEHEAELRGIANQIRDKAGEGRAYGNLDSDRPCGESRNSGQVTAASRSPLYVNAKTFRAVSESKKALEQNKVKLMQFHERFCSKKGGVKESINKKLKSFPEVLMVKRGRNMDWATTGKYGGLSINVLVSCSRERFLSDHSEYDGEPYYVIATHSARSFWHKQATYDRLLVRDRDKGKGHTQHRSFYVDIVRRTEKEASSQEDHATGGVSWSTEKGESSFEWPQVLYRMVVEEEINLSDLLLDYECLSGIKLSVFHNGKSSRDESRVGELKDDIPVELQWVGKKGRQILLDDNTLTVKGVEPGAGEVYGVRADTLDWIYKEFYERMVETDQSSDHSLVEADDSLGKAPADVSKLEPLHGSRSNEEHPCAPSLDIISDEEASCGAPFGKDEARVKDQDTLQNFTVSGDSGCVYYIKVEMDGRLLKAPIGVHQGRFQDQWKSYSFASTTDVALLPKPFPIGEKSEKKADCVGRETRPSRSAQSLDDKLSRQVSRSREAYERNRGKLLQFHETFCSKNGKVKESIRKRLQSFPQVLTIKRGQNMDWRKTGKYGGLSINVLVSCSPDRFLSDHPEYDGEPYVIVKRSTTVSFHEHITDGQVICPENSTFTKGPQVVESGTVGYWVPEKNRNGSYLGVTAFHVLDRCTDSAIDETNFLSHKQMCCDDRLLQGHLYRLNDGESNEMKCSYVCGLYDNSIDVGVVRCEMEEARHQEACATEVTSSSKGEQEKSSFEWPRILHTTVIEGNVELNDLLMEYEVACLEGEKLSIYHNGKSSRTESIVGELIDESPTVFLGLDDDESEICLSDNVIVVKGVEYGVDEPHRVEAGILKSMWQDIYNRKDHVDIETDSDATESKQHKDQDVDPDNNLDVDIIFTAGCSRNDGIQVVKDKEDQGKEEKDEDRGDEDMMEPKEQEQDSGYGDQVSQQKFATGGDSGCVYFIEVKQPDGQILKAPIGIHRGALGEENCSYASSIGITLQNLEKKGFDLCFRVREDEDKEEKCSN